MSQKTQKSIQTKIRTAELEIEALVVQRNFALLHPELNPRFVKRLEGWIDSHLLDATDAENYPTAFAALQREGQRFEPSDSAKAEAEQDAKIQETMRQAAVIIQRQNEQQETEDRAREERSAAQLNPVLAMAKAAQDFASGRGERPEHEPGSFAEKQWIARGKQDGLPREYSREMLVRASRQELKKIKARFGTQAVLDRIDGRS